jgi:hypothetical protein
MFATHFVTAPGALLRRSSCQEHRVCDAEWQVRYHERQREEDQVNACHVQYSFVYSGG